MLNVLYTVELENVISEELKKCESDVLIISAFCKINTLKFIDNYANSNLKKRLLVRFLPNDINSGATDKEIYSYCVENNWELFYDFNLHAKTYVFDKIKCILGSANLTNKGFGLVENYNIELSSYFELKEDDYKKIVMLFSEATRLTKGIYEDIISCINNDEKLISFNSIKVAKNITCLMPEDFPNNDTDLIDLYALKSYMWLKEYLINKESHSAYYGELIENIHNMFIKDPRPYRKDIKQHLSDLFMVMKKFGLEQFIFTRPNYSECITLRV